MPFKSQAQRRKFAELLVKGEISSETFEEWNRETGGRKLPERASKTAGRSTKRRANPASTRTRAGSPRKPRRRGARKK